MPELVFDKIFPNKHPNFTYAAFLQAVGMFPAICRLRSTCPRVLAAVFAHFHLESNGLKDLEDSTQADFCEDKKDWMKSAYPCTPGQQYYGRGAIRIRWSSNYGALSQALFAHPQLLLDRPHLLVEPWLNFAAALWFFVTPKSPKPSMLQVMDGSWRPNPADRVANLVPGFGASTMVISGMTECGANPSIPYTANVRAILYEYLAESLGIDVQDETVSCSTSSQFPFNGSASAVPTFWNPDNHCSLSTAPSGFSALIEGMHSACLGAPRTCQEITGPTIPSPGEICECACTCTMETQSEACHGEETTKAAEEARKASETAEKAAEEAKKAVEEARKSAAEAEKAAEESKRTAKEATKAAEEAAKATEEAAKAAEEAAKAAEEAAKAAEEAAQVKAEEDKKERDLEKAEKAAEEAWKAAEETKKAEEEASKKAEEARKEKEKAEKAQDLAKIEAEQKAAEAKQAQTLANKAAEVSTILRQLTNSGRRRRKRDVNPPTTCSELAGMVINMTSAFDQNTTEGNTLGLALATAIATEPTPTCTPADAALIQEAQGAADSLKQALVEASEKAASFASAATKAANEAAAHSTDKTAAAAAAETDKVAKSVAAKAAADTANAADAASQLAADVKAAAAVATLAADKAAEDATAANIAAKKAADDAAAAQIAANKAAEDTAASAAAAASIAASAAAEAQAAEAVKATAAALAAAAKAAAEALANAAGNKNINTKCKFFTVNYSNQAPFYYKQKLSFLIFIIKHFQHSL